MSPSISYPVVVMDLITLRAAREEDFGSIVSIETESFSDPWSANDFRQVMSSLQSIFLVAEKDDRVVGYALAMFFAGEAELLNIAVTPSQRGSRIGHSLLHAILTTLGENDVESVFLEVRESNVAARALYEKAGFMVMSKRKKYYRNPVEDALILRLAMKR